VVQVFRKLLNNSGERSAAVCPLRLGRAAQFSLESGKIVS
jgi:hypothetical protein